MLTKYRIRVAASIFGALLLQYAPIALAAPAPVVAIESGKLKGASEAGIDSYKGIPFAEPPVGELRWRPPMPITPWQGMRDATAMLHDCMQLPAPSEAAPGGTTTPSEDCLYLNVWTPTGSHGKHLPVMVWIYGGGFLNGGASPAVYDGTSFAQRGVVLVTFNYRLGRFGFFAHPALTAEQIRAASAWKMAYLQRLRREKIDTSYVDAYLRAWNLSWAEVFPDETEQSGLSQ